MKLATCIYHSLCRREQVKTHSKHSVSHIHSWEIPQIDSDMERHLCNLINIESNSVKSEKKLIFLSFLFKAFPVTCFLMKSFITSQRAFVSVNENIHDAAWDTTLYRCIGKLKVANF